MLNSSRGIGERPGDREGRVRNVMDVAIPKMCAGKLHETVPDAVIAAWTGPPARP